MITTDRLHALAMDDVSLITNGIAVPLDAQVGPAGVDTLLRRSHFLGQVCFESGFFGRLTENLYYTSPERIAAVWPKLKPRAESLTRNPQALGNAAYAHVNGNGDEASGDGWLFRGRGLIQLTGRANYAKFATSAMPLTTSPQLAEVATNAVAIALAYWNAAHCNEAADRDSVADVTSKINPAKVGLAERTLLTNRAKTIFI